jgi:hypothetical protein
MMVENHFVLVFNYDHILCTRETKQQCLLYAKQHSAGVSNGRYEIFKLGKPVAAGDMGDTIKWEKE